MSKSFPNADTIHRHQLANGITVLVYENFSAETFVINGVMRGGAIAESAEKGGLSAFTAASLMRGTVTRSFDDIYEQLEAVGADLSFGSGRLLTSFSADALVEDIDLVLSLLADSLRVPTFPAVELEKVRGEIMTRLHMRANDTRSMAGLAFSELLYGDHPLGKPVSGHIETVATITQDDIVDFHRHVYGPDGMIITVVGAISAEDAVARIESALGDWHTPDRVALSAIGAVHRPDELVRTHVDMPDKSQSDIVLGLPGPLRSAPDYLDVRVANTILGVFGMFGRLGKNVREEKGLSYYVYSVLTGGLLPSPWTVRTGVAPHDVELAIDSIRAEIRRIQDEPVSADELADTQAYLTGSLPVSLETNDGLASIIEDLELYDLGLDYLDNYRDAIYTVSAERVQQAAQTYFSADEIAIAVVGPQRSS
ncbi:MAG: insulinase family protein [Anaerolineae bacterium]|nr:insulinase family protein [Anaerolineae bacterium]